MNPLSYFCLDFSFYDLEYGLQKAEWDRRLPNQADIDARVAGFEEVNSGRETVTLMLHNLYNSFEVYQSLDSHEYKWIQSLSFFKKYKEPFSGPGLAYSMEYAHIACKDLETVKRMAPSEKRGANCITVNNAPRYCRDKNGRILNPTVKTEEIPRKVLTMFPPESFRSCSQVLMMSNERIWGSCLVWPWNLVTTSLQRAQSPRLSMCSVVISRKRSLCIASDITVK